MLTLKKKFLECYFSDVTTSKRNICKDEFQMVDNKERKT